MLRLIRLTVKATKIRSKRGYRFWKTSDKIQASQLTEVTAVVTTFGATATKGARHRLEREQWSFEDIRVILWKTNSLFNE